MISKEDKTFLFDKIENGEITTWIQFIMNVNIIGCEVDKDIVVDIFKRSCRLCFYELILDAVTNDNYMDEYFDDKIISYIMKMNNMGIFGNNYTISPIHSKVDALNVFSRLDSRNPVILLKYFFGFEKDGELSVFQKYYRLISINRGMRDIFFKTLKMTIRRCEIRKKINPKFSEFEKRLNIISDNLLKIVF